MADDEVLQLTLVHGSRKYPVELLTKKDGGPTVEDLANIAAQVAEVPRGYQRLIFKGQSLTEFAKPLMTFGIKKGSKVMLIGKKFDPLEEENMKKILATEKMADNIEKRLTEHQEEVSGIEKGYLQAELIPKALEKLSRKLKGINEEFMKTLESLDALIIDASLQQAKGKKKSLIQRIQVLLDKTDETSSKIESLRDKC
ncbi:BAG family molecular chaperone regulator 1-like [Porites lutea]|uniref:BAG family molecular chaperone regulator 1-like n=1 Tax=Porites lutea TaxID=51062 RepID=UPI003CC67111